MITNRPATGTGPVSALDCSTEYRAPRVDTTRATYVSPLTDGLDPDA